MRQITFVAVAVLACVAYAVQAKAGPQPPHRLDERSSVRTEAAPESEPNKDAESVP
jgi:hypothetical protein